MAKVQYSYLNSKAYGIFYLITGFRFMFECVAVR